MSNSVLSVAGWALVAVTVVDVFRTVVWSNQGAGPVTALLTGAGRRVLSVIGDGHRQLHSAIGPVVLLAIVATWSLLLLVGFTLVLQMDPDAVRTATTDQPSDWSERAYYVGYSLFTLGNGDLAPTTDAARALTVLMNALGMFLITLSVTYLLPVISASVGSRSFGSSVSSLGDTPEDIVTGAWDGHRIHLDHQLRTLASELSVLAQQHLAYPVLHLFHSADPTTSAPRGVASLDDVLTLLEAVDPAVAPRAPGRRQLRSSIERYLDTYGPHVDGGDPPPPPSLDVLAAAGIPLLQDRAAFEEAVAADGDRRGQVQALARTSGTARR